MPKVWLWSPVISSLWASICLLTIWKMTSEDPPSHSLWSKHSTLQCTQQMPDKSQWDEELRTDLGHGWGKSTLPSWPSGSRKEPQQQLCLPPGDCNSPPIGDPFQCLVGVGGACAFLNSCSFPRKVCRQCGALDWKALPSASWPQLLHF